MASIKKNYMYSMFYQILQFILPLVTAPYVSRVLGKDGIGCFSWTRSIAYYFLLFAMLGVNNYGNRKVAQVRSNKDELNTVFSEIFQTQFIFSSISIIVYLIYVLFFVKEYKIVFLIQLVYLASAAFDINWLFFGLEEFKITVTRKSIIKVLNVILVFIFVKNKNDVYIYTFIMCLGYFIGQCYLWTNIKKHVKFKPCKLVNIKKHIIPLFILFIPTIATSVYRVMDKIMIGKLASISDVGLYENADKIIAVCLGVISAWGNVMLPRTSNLYANKQYEQCKQNLSKSIQFIICISTAMAFGLAAISRDFVVVFFGKEFTNSGSLLIGLAFSLFFIGISNTTRTQILIPLGMDKQYVRSVSIGAIANFIINFILINKIGVLGAVIGTLVTEFLVAAIQVIFAKKILDPFRLILCSIPYIVIGLIMFISVYFISNILNIKLIYKLIIEITLGFVVYTALVLVFFIVTKNELYVQAKKTLKRKKK